MDRLLFEQWKRRISLLDYLQSNHWEPCRKSASGQIGGLCPLHPETRPSFWVHPRKGLFYCHGCGQGGDVIRLVERWHRLNFPDALAHWRAWLGSPGLLAETAAFYRAQLPRFPEAAEYLRRRGIQDRGIIADLRIGYAPGACLRAHLQGLGWGIAQMRAAGVINAQGRDSWYHRIVFPSEENLYGRSLEDGGGHRFLSGPKGGLYGWNHLSHRSDVLLVEGMFDVAALWQAGFRHTTCAWGTHLNPTQYQQLASGERTLWMAFDGDAAGQLAAHSLSQKLRAQGRRVRCIVLPDGHDPASFFASGASVSDFHHLLHEALP